jgi:DNA modification methylase
MTTQNHLYYGDNLEVLRRHIPDESVDLVYLDPPFNSNADYNVLFAEEDGSRAAAQIEAFGDTWRWDQAAAAAFQETVEQGGEVAKAMVAFQTLLGDSNMLAYLAMMAPRLVELRRVLKSTGSIYLHCDPTASHYLKLLLDSVFGADRFLNEVTWKRTFSHGNVGRNFGRVTDTILVYTRSESYTWVQQYSPYGEEYVEGYFRHHDEKGRYRTVSLRNPSKRPNLHYPYTASNGLTYQPHPNGWAVSEKRMKAYDEQGRLHFPKKESGALLVKQYLDDKPGVKLQNLWTDIPPIGAHAAERLGYPTQKPVALLERIIATSSEPDAVVLDPFAGCGTTIAAAEKLGRRWIGIDVTFLAVSLLKSRLKEVEGVEYEIVGEPTSSDDAAQLAADDPYQFQWWALGLIGARPVEEKKGADKGIDGRLYFFDDGGSKAKQLIVSVKAGKVQVSHVRDLVGVLQREGAEIGALISLNEPTGPMKKEAASAGMYKSPLTGTTHPRVQLITVAELLDGRTLDLPAIAPQQSMTAKPVAAPAKARPDQLTLGGD